MLGIATPALAAGNDKIDSISNEYQLESNGTLKVKESITYTFGSEKHGLLRSFSEQTPFGASKFRLYQHGDFTVTDENGTAIPYTKEPRGSFLDLKIGDPQKTISGTHTYNLTYSVLNTVATSSDGTQGFSWNPTGTNWNVPIGNIKASFVGLPATLMPPKCSPATSCVITSSADRIDIAGAGQPFDVSFNFAANTFPVANAQFINNPNYGEPAKNSDTSQSFLTPIVVGILIVVVGAVVWGIIAINRNKNDSSIYSYPYASSTPPTVVKYFSKAELSNIAAILTTKGHIYSKDPKGDVLYHKGDEYLNEVEKKVVDTGFAGSKSVTAKDFKKNLDSLFIERSNYTSYLDYINSQAETVSSQARSYDYSASSSNSSRSFIGRQTDYSSDVATQLLIASILMNQYDSSSAYDNSSHSNTSSSSSDSSSYSSSSSSSSYDYGSSSSYSSYDSSSSYDSGSSSSSDGGGSW